MTETLKQEIMTSISEEEHDAEKYRRMAEEAKKCGHNHVAGVLEDIACEECIHKKYLSEIIDGTF